MPAHALAWQFCQSGAVRGLTYLQRQAMAERAVETGCPQTARLLVTGPGGPEDVGTLGLSLSAGMLEATAAAGELAVCKLLRE